jgi:hypothetical protein
VHANQETFGLLFFHCCQTEKDERRDEKHDSKKKQKQMDAFTRWALIVLGGIVAVLLLTKIPHARSSAALSIALRVFHEWVDEVRKLETLTAQDNNPLLAVIHSTSALSKLALLQSLDMSHRLAQKLDVDLESLRVKLSDLQSDALGQVANMCPDLRLEQDVEWT